MEFQQQVEVEPVTPPAHTPDEIVAPAAQVVTDLTVAHPFEGGEVHVVHPRLVDKAPQQVFYHTGMREQEFVAGIVFHEHEYSAWEDPSALGKWQGILRDVMKQDRAQRHLLVLPELFGLYCQPAREKTLRVQPEESEDIDPLMTVCNQMHPPAIFFPQTG